MTSEIKGMHFYAVVNTTRGEVKSPADVSSDLKLMNFTIKLNDPLTIKNASDVILQKSRELKNFPEIKDAGITIFAKPLSMYSDDPLFHSVDVPFDLSSLSSMLHGV